MAKGQLQTSFVLCPRSQCSPQNTSRLFNKDMLRLLFVLTLPVLNVKLFVQDSIKQHVASLTLHLKSLQCTVCAVATVQQKILSRFK